MRLFAAVAVLFASIPGVVSAQPAKAAVPPSGTKTLVPGTTKTKMITVSEGTDMAVTVSPDHKTMLMDLQGLEYSLPMAGGTAKQITTAYDEDSHPDWSARGGLVAVQSYAGGTFHIWTMHPDGTGK